MISAEIPGPGNRLLQNMENENFIIDLVDSDGILPSSSPFKPDTVKQLISPRKHSSYNKTNDKLSSPFNKDSYKKYTDDLVKISTVLDRINSPDKVLLHQEEEMSPLEDFYSLKNAASDDEDARYFYSLFKNELLSATDSNPLDSGTEPVVTYSNYKRTLLESSDENHSNEYGNVDKKYRTNRLNNRTFSKRYFNRNKN